MEEELGVAAVRSHDEGSVPARARPRVCEVESAGSADETAALDWKRSLR